MSLTRALGNTGAFALSLFLGFVALGHFHSGLAPEFERILHYESRRIVPAFQFLYIKNVGQLQSILGMLVTNAAVFSLWQPTRWLGLRIASIYFFIGLAAQTYIGDKGNALMPSSLALTACLILSRMIAA